MATTDFYWTKESLAFKPRWLVGNYNRAIVMPGAKDFTSVLSLQLRRLGWQHGGRIIQRSAATLSIGSTIIENGFYTKDILDGKQNLEQIKDHYDSPFTSPMFWIYQKIEPWLISLGKK